MSNSKFTTNEAHFCHCRKHTDPLLFVKRFFRTLTDAMSLRDYTWLSRWDHMSPIWINTFIVQIKSKNKQRYLFDDDDFPQNKTFVNSCHHSLTNRQNTWVKLSACLNVIQPKSRAVDVLWFSCSLDVINEIWIIVMRLHHKKLNRTRVQWVASLWRKCESLKCNGKIQSRTAELDIVSRDEYDRFTPDPADQWAAIALQLSGEAWFR